MSYVCMYYCIHDNLLLCPAEDEVGTGGTNSVSRGAVAGIVFGVIAGLIQI